MLRATWLYPTGHIAETEKQGEGNKKEINRKGHLSNSQKTTQVLSLKGKPITFILLKEHSNKLTPNDILLYP